MENICNSEMYYKTEQSVQEYIQLAKGYNGKKLIEKLKDFLPFKSSILEIGSGPGVDWEILRNDYDVIGSDNSSFFLEHLIKKFPTGTFIELDAVTLKTSKSFDCIYSNKVLHHLKDEELETSIQNQLSLLNPEGVICHSFWKGTGTEMFKGLFVNYHSKENLTRIFSKKYEIQLLEHYMEFEDEDSIILIARKE